MYCKLAWTVIWRISLASSLAPRFHFYFDVSSAFRLSQLYVCVCVCKNRQRRHDIYSIKQTESQCFLFDKDDSRIRRRLHCDIRRRASFFESKFLIILFGSTFFFTICASYRVTHIFTTNKSHLWNGRKTEDHQWNANADNERIVKKWNRKSESDRERILNLNCNIKLRQTLSNRCIRETIRFFPQRLERERPTPRSIRLSGKYLHILH